MARYALLTVSDRTGLEEFACGLCNLGFSIIASDGTAQFLRERGIEVTRVEDYTKQRAVMQPQGIKLIHPKIFGGILADLNNPNHVKDLADFDIVPFEVVACNFYPFEKDQRIINVDIGGPAMARCAAKNYQRVTVIVDPSDYPRVLKELQSGGVTESTRRELARRAFEASVRHDEAILAFLEGS